MGTKKINVSIFYNFGFLPESQLQNLQYASTVFHFFTRSKTIVVVLKMCMQISQKNCIRNRNIAVAMQVRFVTTKSLSHNDGVNQR